MKFFLCLQKFVKAHNLTLKPRNCFAELEAFWVEANRFIVAAGKSNLKMKFKTAVGKESHFKDDNYFDPQKL